MKIHCPEIFYILGKFFSFKILARCQFKMMMLFFSVNHPRSTTLPSDIKSFTEWM